MVASPLGPPCLERPHVTSAAATRRHLRRRALRRPALLAALLVIATGCTPAAVLEQTTSSTGPPEGSVAVERQPTRAAGAFVDSLGVNVHWDYPDTPYGGDYEGVRRLLVDSGIAHVRGQEMRAADLHRDGITTTVVVDRRTGDEDTPAARLEAMRPLIASGAVDALEGPNEPDLFWTREDRRYRGEPFPQGPLLWQQELYRAAQSDSSSARLPVIGMSFGRTYWGGGHPYGAGQLRGSADWGNIHPYPGPNTFTDPVPYAGIDRYYWNADFPSLSMDRHPINLETYRPPFGDLPMSATENGYSTWRLGQSEKMQGRYMPRLFLEGFRLGLERTYSYELVDEFVDPSGEDREAHFGLVRHDLTPKPAYTAVQSLLRAVGDGADPGAAVTERLDYRLDVTPPAGFDARYLHHVVLQRRDGSHVIALWHEVSGDDLSGRDKTPPEPIREVEQPPMDVSLGLATGDDRLGLATVRTLDDEGHLQETGATNDGDTLQLSVPDRVTLVDIPASATSMPRPPGDAPATPSPPPGDTGGPPAPPVSVPVPAPTSVPVPIPDAPVGAPEPTSPGPATFERIAGADRVGTALAAAAALAPEGSTPASAAVVAGSDDFADAMVGAPLSRAVEGPLLLSGREGLDPRTGDGLRRLLAPGATVHLLGGTEALDRQVERDVLALGFTVRRLSGADRYQTAAATSEEVAARSGGRCEPVLATGRGFADSASASGLLASEGRTLLFTDGDQLPASTVASLTRCLPGLRGQVTAVGGPAAAAVEGAALATAAGLRTSSLVGSDRYETSVAVWSSQTERSEQVDGVVLASGNSFADALVGGTFRMPVLLTAPSGLPDVVRDALRRRPPDRLVVIGGRAALPDRVAAAAEEASKTGKAYEERTKL